MQMFHEIMVMETMFGKTEFWRLRVQDAELNQLHPGAMKLQ